MGKTARGAERRRTRDRSEGPGAQEPPKADFLLPKVQFDAQTRQARAEGRATRTHCPPDGSPNGRSGWPSTGSKISDFYRRPSQRRPDCSRGMIAPCQTESPRRGRKRPCQSLGQGCGCRLLFRPGARPQFVHTTIPAIRRKSKRGEVQWTRINPNVKNGAWSLRTGLKSGGRKSHRRFAMTMQNI